MNREKRVSPECNLSCWADTNACQGSHKAAQTLFFHRVVWSWARFCFSHSYFPYLKENNEAHCLPKCTAYLVFPGWGMSFNSFVTVWSRPQDLILGLFFFLSSPCIQWAINGPSISSPKYYSKHAGSHEALQSMSDTRQLSTPLCSQGLCSASFCQSCSRHWGRRQRTYNPRWR